MDLSDDDDDDFPVRNKRFKSSGKSYPVSWLKISFYSYFLFVSAMNLKLIVFKLFIQDYDHHRIDLTRDQNDKASNEYETDIKDQHMRVLHETIRNLQTQLLENQTKEKENLTKISVLEEKLKQANVKELLLKTRIVEVTKHQNNQKPDSSDIEISENESDKELDDDCIRVLTPPLLTMVATASATQTSSKNEPLPRLLNGVAITSGQSLIDVNEAKLIGLLSTFLVVHPFGASLDYVFSYVQRFAPFLRPKELEEILSRHTNIFSEEVTGVGAKIERKWKFCGFDSSNESSTTINQITSSTTTNNTMNTIT